MITLALLFAFLAPLLGRIAPNFLIPVLILIFTGAMLKRASRDNLRGFIPFLGIYAGWIVLLFYQSLGFDGFAVVSEMFGLKGIWVWFSQKRLPELKIFSGMMWLVFLGAGYSLISLFTRNSKADIKDCFLWAGFVGSLSLILEKFAILSSLLPPLEQHWSLLERPSGLFTDPNAAGLFLGLLLPFVFDNFRQATLRKSLWFVAFCAAGVFSGSRTFVIALILSVILSIPRVKWRLTICGLILLLGTGLVILSKAAPSDYKNLAGKFPRGIERVFLTAASFEGNDSVESRVIFFKLAKWMWQDHPIAGIGPGQFPFVIDRYEHRLGVDLSGWRDNSNNFYMGTLAELGLIGFAALVFLLASLIKKISLTNSQCGGPTRQSLIIFAMLLCLGPHWDFPEVGFLVGALVGSISQTGPQIFRLNPAAIFSIFCLGVVISGQFMHTGLSPGKYTNPQARWSSVTASFYLPCINDSVTLHLGGRNNEGEPLRYKLSSNKTEIRNSIDWGQKRLETLSCSGDKTPIRVINYNPFKFFPPGSSIEKYSLRGVKILNYSVN